MTPLETDRGRPHGSGVYSLLVDSGVEREWRDAACALTTQRQPVGGVKIDEGAGVPTRVLLPRELLHRGVGINSKRDF